MMKKIFMLPTMLAMLAGSLLSSCESSKKEAQVAEEQDSVEISVPKKVSSNHGKVLVAYFTVPETDGVDASSGASRVNEFHGSRWLCCGTRQSSRVGGAC